MLGLVTYFSDRSASPYDQSNVISPPCLGSVIGRPRQTAVPSFHASSQPSNHGKTRTTRKCLGAMRHVDAGRSISAPETPESLNRLIWNLARLITSTVWPHMQNMVAAATYGTSYHFSFFGWFNACAQQRKRGFLLNACSTQNGFRWWVFSFVFTLLGGHISPVYRQKRFSMSRYFL